MKPARPSSLLDAALKYREAGFSVIPVGCDKRPLIRWTEFQSRRADESEIRNWWSKWPDANVGIVTGKVSGIVVLDVDGKEGRSSLDGKILPLTPTVKTGRGWHFYLEYSEYSDSPVPGRIGFLPGLDLKADGGYVVAPPSVHGSGAVYEWVDGHGADVPRAPLPAWVLDEIKAGAGQLVSRSSEDYAALLRGVEEGRRHDTTVTLCGRYAALGASETEVVQLAMNQNARCNSPRPEAEVIRDATDIWAREQETRRTGQPSPSPTVSRDILPSDEAVNDVQPVALGDFLAGPVPTVDWLVDGLIARGILVAVAGEPRSTKSWVTNDLGIAVASGQDFLGYRVPKPGRVLLVQEEDTRGELQRGLSQLCEGRGLDSKALPIFVYHQAGVMIDNPMWQRRLIALIEQLQVDLLILDPFNYIHGQEEKDQYKMTRHVLQPVLELRRRFPILTIVIVHHYRKETKDQSKRPAQMLRGTSALAGAVKNIIGITKAGDGRFRVDQDSKQGSVEPFLYTIEGRGDDPRRLVVCGTAEDAETQANAEKVLQVARELYAEGGAQACLVKSLSKKAGLTESTTRRAAKFYCDKKKLREVEARTEKNQKAWAYIPADIPEDTSDSLLGDVGTLALSDDSLDNLPASPMGECFPVAP